jgi:hypothetical protein
MSQGYSPQVIKLECRDAAYADGKKIISLQLVKEKAIPENKSPP